MRTNDGRPVLRLLAIPVLGLVGLVLAVVALGTATPRTPDPTTAVADLAAVPAADEVLGCSRDGDPAAVDAARAAADGARRVSSAMVTACPVAFDGP